MGRFSGKTEGRSPRSSGKADARSPRTSAQDEQTQGRSSGKADARSPRSTKGARSPVYTEEPDLQAEEPTFPGFIPQEKPSRSPSKQNRPAEIRTDPIESRADPVESNGLEDEEDEVSQRLRVIIRKMRNHLLQLDNMKTTFDSTCDILENVENAAEEAAANDITVGLEYLHQVVGATAEVLEWQAHEELPEQDIFAQTMDAVQNASPKAKAQPKMLTRTARATNLGGDVSAVTAVV